VDRKEKILDALVVRALRDETIASLRQYEGKRLGIDVGNPVDMEDEGYPEFPVGCAYAFKLPNGALVFEENIRHGRLYHCEEAAYEGYESSYRANQTVIGYSFDVEGNLFHAGNYDAQQSALDRLLESAAQLKKKTDDDHCSISPLDAVIEALHCIGIHPEEECRGNPELATLANCKAKPEDAIEFVAHLSNSYGLDFSTPLCRKVGEMFAKAKYVQVHDLVDLIRLVFLEDHLDPSKLTLFNDEGKCRHFELNEEGVMDFPDDETFFGNTSQQCLMCKYWCDTGVAGVEDPHWGCLGKCTWRWMDPNGDKQQTFWKE